MSELSRRDFLKASAAGLATVGTSGLLLSEVAQAAAGNQMTMRSTNATKLIRTQCPPMPPERMGSTGEYYIICPSDDVELQRDYSALVHVVNNVPNVVYYGTSWFPFDGSYVEETADCSENDYYLCRAVCNGLPQDDAPEVCPARKSTTLPTDRPMTAESVIRAPKPPVAEVREKAHGSGQVRIRVPRWEPELPDTAHLTRAQVVVIEANLDGTLIQPPHPSLRNGRQNRDVPRVVRKATSHREIFNGMDLWVELKPAHVYYVMTEVIYDYGAAAGSIPFRGKSSWLQVDMRTSDHERDEIVPPRRPR